MSNNNGFEYKIAEETFGWTNEGSYEEECAHWLDQWGKDGWELVSMIPRGPIIPEGFRVIFTFKRPCGDGRE